MMDARTETVIIPHPNEQATLAAAQRRLLCALQEQADGALWIPLYPPYLRGLPEDAAVTSCVLTRLRADGERIVLDAEAATPTGTLRLTLPLALRLATKSPAQGGAAQTTLPRTDGALPLRLPVFRIARVTFTQTGARTDWTVDESRWVKAKRCETEAEIL